MNTEKTITNKTNEKYFYRKNFLSCWNCKTDKKENFRKDIKRDEIFCLNCGAILQENYRSYFIIKHNVIEVSEYTYKQIQEEKKYNSYYRNIK